MAVFAAAALFVFLVLAAQYESWKTPLSIVLILPMCLLASATGLQLRGMPIDILAQIGSRRLGWTSRKERNLDRGVCSSGGSPRRDLAASGSQCSEDKTSSNLDDLFRVHFGCRTASRGNRRGR